MIIIEVDGQKYKVMETLPYQQAGMQAKMVATPKGARVAVKRGGTWTWWTFEDRIAPMKRKYEDKVKK